MSDADGASRGTVSQVVARATLSEEVGLPRTDEIVVAGLTVEPIRLDDATTLTVRTPDGELRPVQRLGQRRGTDGRINWLALAFPVDCPAGASTEVEVVAGATAEPVVGALTVSADGDETVVAGQLGPELRFGAGEYLVHPGPLLPDGLTASAGLDGVDCPASIESVEVVSRGPLLVEVRLRGRYAADPAAGPRLDAGLEARVRIRAGGPSLQVALAVVADAERDETPLTGWRVEFGTGLVARATVGAFDRAASAAPPLELTHGGGGHPRGIFAVSTVSGGTEWRDESDSEYYSRWEWAELQGDVAQNWIVTSGPAEMRTIAVERFWEHHPAALRCAPEHVAVDLFDGSVGAAELTRGSAPRRRLSLAPGDDRAAGARLDHPLVAFDPGALGRIRPEVLPYRPATLPNLEALIRGELFGWYQWGQSLGFYDHGDGMQSIAAGPRVGYSSNNEHDALYALLLHYLRSGERAYLDSAVAYGDHTVDIDLVHATGEPHELGGLRAHGQAHVHYVTARSDVGTVRTSIDTGHMWVEGLLLLGQVTGEPRYLEAAVGVGECLLGLEKLGWTRPEPGPRNAGWPLIALAALARDTGDQRFADAALRIARAAVDRQAPDGRWLMRLGRLADYCAWQNAVLLVGLHRLVDLTGAADLRAAVERGGRALLELGRTPEGTFIYLTRYDYRWTHRTGLVREALACLFQATADPAYLRAGLLGGARWYPTPGRARVTSEEIAEWRGHLPFLGCAERAGLLEDLP